MSCAADGHEAPAHVDDQATRESAIELPKDRPHRVTDGIVTERTRRRRHLDAHVYADGHSCNGETTERDSVYVTDPLREAWWLPNRAFGW